MLEAELAEAQTLKKLLEAIKELITDANFQCNEQGISLQAMDNSHVAHVFVQLEKAVFVNYRCDSPISIGVHLNSFAKILKCAKDDDVCILNAAADDGMLHLTYKAKDAGRISKYRLKLIDMDTNTFDIPDTYYDVRVKLPSEELLRIVRELSVLGESVRVDVSKDDVKFTTEGASADGNILLKHTEDEGGVSIVTNQDITLNFSLKYLVNIAKSESLSPQVLMGMNANVPLLVLYRFGHGRVQYYLTPSPRTGDEQS
ncbi:proliferating cell nuclear antigen, N-terminal domain-containing protein [Thelephora terrestris]|uniref:DNA sliding clamp PCNA n=1 Tax=Thelephora terrestris TaxID=56493 RepID=A0A9P6H1L8_9AGAM|nr:proliferating cell nuclear antigen, N-terminal domain-containing protein [Thelephora terrestris]